MLASETNYQYQSFIWLRFVVYLNGQGLRKLAGLFDTYISCVVI